jgi:hypothetical protein
MSVKRIGNLDGGMVMISSTTVSDATSLAFSNIPSNYKNLHIRWYDVKNSLVNTHLYIVVNDDTANVYQARFMRMVNNALAYSTGGGGGFGGGHDGWGVVPSADTSATLTQSSVLAQGYLNIMRYAENGQREMESHSTGYRLTTTPTFFGLWWGHAVYNPPTARNVPITKVEFLRSSTQTFSGKFYLYGVY